MSALGRPKKTTKKTVVLSLRTFPAVRDAIAEYAQQEHRTVALMADLLLREAVIARKKRDKEPTKEIEGLA